MERTWLLLGMVEEQVYYRYEEGRVQSAHDPEPCEERGKGNKMQQPGGPKVQTKRAGNQNGWIIEGRAAGGMVCPPGGPCM